MDIPRILRRELMEAMGAEKSHTIEVDFSEVENEAEALQVLEKGINKALPDGVTATLAGEEGWYQKESGKRHLLDTIPEEWRDLFRNNVEMALANADAELVRIDYNYNFAPLIVWRFRGDEERAYIYLDGKPMKGDSFALRNIEEHTMTSLVEAVYAHRQGHAD